MASRGSNEVNKSRHRFLIVRSNILQLNFKSSFYYLLPYLLTYLTIDIDIAILSQYRILAESNCTLWIFSGYMLAG